MKRFLSLFIILVLMLGTLASCSFNFPWGGETTTEPAEEADIQDAVKRLNDMYEDLNGTSIPNGKELVATVKVGRTVFDVAWSSDNELVTFTYEDGLCYVNIGEITEDAEYTITAAITSPAGQSATVTYNLLLSVASDFGMITEPKAGVAYKFALLHGNEGTVVYFDGNNYNNYAWYLSYTTDVLAAVDVYLEEVEGVEGGYRLYFEKEGVKTYIVAFPRDGDTTKGTLKLDTEVPTEYYTYSTEYNTLIYTSVTGEQFYIGSSGTYKSISCSSISYIGGATSYPSRLYGMGGIVEELPEQELPTVPENYTSKDVVEALYKLESGQTLEGPYVITGVITSIKYAYDPAYDNVSVNIVVEGAEDKPVLCYRLIGGSELKVGDTITVFAGVTNYGGTYETVSGGVIREVIPGTGEVPTPPTPDVMTIPEVLASAEGASVVVSGTVSEIYQAWSDQYNNISFYISDAQGNKLLVFRTGTNVVIGDQVTVTGTATVYNGTIQIAQGATTVVDVPASGGSTTPSDSIILNLTGNSNLVSGSAAQNVFSANGITLTNDKASSSSDLTVQASYAQRFYAGSTITIAYPGMTKIVLTLDDYSDGKYLKGFDGMTIAGATITRENDVVTIIFDSAVDSFTSATFPSQVRCEKIEVFTGEVEGGGNVGGGDEPNPPVEDDEYTAPVVGTPYYLHMVLPSGTVYFTGAMSGDYLATTTDKSQAVAIYFEEVSGGYHIYFMTGETKTYITAAAYIKSSGYAGCHFSLTTETPTLAWTYDTTYGIIEIYDEVDGKSDTFFAGTYGTYNTVSLSGAYYKDQISSGTQYPARLEAVEGGEVTPPVEGGDEPNPPAHEHNFVDGKCECGEEDPNYVPPVTEGPEALTSLKTGDKVYIVAPAYNMALSADKVSASSYYNKGVDVSGGFTGLTNAEIWEVTVNADGSYTFTSLTGSTLALADQYSSFNDTGANKSWVLEEVSTGVYKVKNTVRGLYIEWYADKNNWSAYGTANNDLFHISFYAYELAEGGEDTPVEPPVDEHEHNFVDGKCECGEEDPNYVPPSEGGDEEVVAGGSADFDTIQLEKGDSSYTKTYTTADGWVITNSAIQCGGASVINPQFPVIGADPTSKAPCLNGKTTAPGKITSPTLTGGISKLTMNYTKMFTDTVLSVTITVTDLTTGEVYTHVVEREEAKDTKYVVWTDEWVLDVAIEGDFTIEIVNNCPSANSSSNKDRFTILDLSWTK